MMSCPTGEQLRGYLDERLDDVQRDAIEKHAEDCAACQQCLAELSGTTFVAPARATPEHEPDEAFLRRLKQALSSAHLGTASTPSPRPASPTSPPQVPGYEILHELGRGGMGVVYKARQLSLGRLVAVKMILSGSHASAQERQRFRAEAEAVALLQHPNIVQIHEVGESDSHPFFSLEFVEGPTLAQRLAGKSLHAAEAAGLVEMLARAVQYAHERGILHRDLKPANILLAVQGGGQRHPPTDRSALLNCDFSRLTPKIADFGLAKQLSGEAGHTRTGSVLGTPDYIAPEQAAGAKTIGPAADIYALGVILYECLTGRPPFRNDTPLDTLLQVTSAEPVPPSRLQAKLPRDLETICLKCLEKEPSARYATARDFADDLRRFVEGRPIAARPVGRAGRLLRWARRKPLVAALTGAVAALLLIVAIGSSATALYLQATLTDSETNRGRAEIAERDSQDKLWRSYREQARALRLSGQAGQRFEALKVLAEASRIAQKLQIGEEGVLRLRNEAVACLALADLRFERTLLANVPEKMPHMYWIAFDPLFHYFVYSDRSGNLSIRRVADGMETDRLAAPELPPRWVSLGFSSNGQWLHADYSWDSPGPRSQAAVWEFRAGKLGRKVDFEYGCVFSPDSTHAASIRPDGSICICEIASGREVKRFGEGLGGSRAQFHPAGRLLAVSLRPDDRRAAVFDCQTGEEVGRRYEHDQAVVSMAWRGDGRLLAAACDDQRIYIWDREGTQSDGSGRLQSVLEGHAGLGIVVRFSHAGDFLVSTGWDGTTRLWDPVSGRQLVQAEGHFVDVRRDDRRLVLISGEHNNDLGVWEVAGGWECRTLHHGFVGNRTPRPEHWGPTSLDFSPDGRMLVSSHLDGVRLWDLANFTEAGYLPVSWTANGRFDPRGDGLFTYGLSGLHHWPIRQITGATQQTGGGDVLQVGLPHTFDVPGSWTHPTLVGDRLGRRLLALDFARSRAFLYDLNEPSKKVVLRHSGMNGCTLSPDGRWALTISNTEPNKSNVKVWDAEGKVVWRPPADERISFFTPDGRSLVTAPPGDAPFRLWELGSWQPGPTLPKPSAKPLHLGPSPDGTVLVSMETGPPRFFHIASGKELATLEAPRNFGGSAGATFNPDGTWLAVATGNHTVHLWDLRAIRRGLAKLDLDWDLPSYPPPVSKEEAKPVRLEVPGEVAQFLKVRDGFLLGQEQALLKQWQAAIESFSKVIEREKTYYDAYNERGRAYAELKQWREAEADFGKAAELAPGQSGVWYSRALVCLALDDINAYRKICATMLERFGQTPQADDAYWMAWTCAVRPDSAVEPAATVRLAERLVDDATPGIDDLVVLGAALYRAGRFKDAVGRLQEAALAHQAGREGRQTIVYAWLYLAMAEHRLGRSEAARKWLDRAADSLAKREGKSGAGGTHSDGSLTEGRGSWNRRLTLQLLRSEAEAELKQPY